MSTGGNRVVEDARVQGPDPVSVGEMWRRELPGVDVTNIVLASAVHRVAQLLEQDFTELAREHDLLPSELRVLFALRRSPGETLSPTQLFRQLMITSGAVSKQVARLCERHLVSRRLDPDVPRGVLVQLEPAGRDIAEQAVRRMSLRHAGLEDLDRGTAKSAITALREVLAALDTSLSTD
ncbi:MarR family winged helix-turn-helix transcriptional regulator [Lentzea sp. NPDC058450]|uniref:MarR family winged helix-turn-helix transcriptional regulator n=1 Tax=Lentzea sp. NPDC058450 TaxID=3346505 RepID=UPI0036679B93